jgi:hypothetical protein
LTSTIIGIRRWLLKNELGIATSLVKGLPLVAAGHCKLLILHLKVIPEYGLEHCSHAIVTHGQPIDCKITKPFSRDKEKTLQKWKLPDQPVFSFCWTSNRKCSADSGARKHIVIMNKTGCGLIVDTSATDVLLVEF